LQTTKRKMPTSIPAEKGIVLGSIIHPKRIEYFQKVGQIEEPMNVIEDQLETLIASTRNFEAIYNEMVNMGVEQEDLMKIKGEQQKLRKEMAKTAINLGNATIMSQNKLRLLREREGAKLSHVVPSSPVDWSQTEMKHLPLAADSMNLDVHYFRNEGELGKVNSHAHAVSNHVSRTFSAGQAGGKRNSDLGKSAHNAMLKQTNNHKLEGTIIITAQCTHKSAIVMDPFILNPIKAVTAWNMMYPKDVIETDPKSIYSTALAKSTATPKKMHILSGTTMGSSFVGMVHILKEEKTKSAQSNASLAKAMRQEMSTYLVMSEQAGSFGPAEQASDGMKRLLSSSGVKNHCNLVTEGIIPNISSNKMLTTVKTLKPTAREVMTQLSAIQGASDGVINGTMDSMASKAKTGAQFMKLNSEYIKDTVSALGKHDVENNQILDMNALMSAFTDYVEKAIEGSAGSPVTMDIREIEKRDIASSYINKYYPNGASGDIDNLGQLGIKSKKRSSGSGSGSGSDSDSS